MLAERRKKTFYSNPRGTLWANDKEKFGQRLLSKMGWEEGQGLGKNSDGMTESLKASMKFNSDGLGLERKNNVWIEDNNAYEQILADLAAHHQQAGSNGGDGSDQDADQDKQNGGSANNTFDLVQKSKVNGRLHYRHKFIKAKNLSMKSQSDLDCIFGKTATKPQNDPWAMVYEPPKYGNQKTDNSITKPTKKRRLDEDEVDDKQPEPEVIENDPEEDEEEARRRRKAEKKERKRLRRLEREQNGQEEENSQSTDKDSDDKANDKEFFQTIQSKLSVQDYFKQRMAEKLAPSRQKTVPATDSSADKEREHETDKEREEGEQFPSRAQPVDGDEEVSQGKDKRKKKKRSKQRDEELEE